MTCHAVQGNPHEFLKTLTRIVTIAYRRSCYCNGVLLHRPG